MPIRIDNDLPAKAVLEEENVFVMDKERACTQDIRPLKIAILNLMPNKLDTELHLLRSLSYTITVRYHIFTDRILCSNSCIRITYGEIL